MRVAALYDIHGNLPALEAVLNEIREEAVDAIVVGGDVVCGPMTRETLRCLLDLEIPVRFIQGNAEVAVLAEMAGAPSTFPEPIRDVLRWEAQELAEYRTLFAAWPMTLRLPVAGAGDVLFCHATPRNEDEIFTCQTPDAILRPAFAGVDVPVVVYGHTHMQFDRMVAGIRVLNAGSAGMPFGEPGAYWLLLGPDVQLRRTAYDVANAAERIRRTGYPQAEQFAATDILQPPSAEAMLQVFETVELR